MIEANGVELCTSSLGNPADPPILLIMGIGASMLWWEEGFCRLLADGVVRPVVFMAYSGEARWRDSAGEEYTARLGEPLTAEHTARAWRTAFVIASVAIR